MRIEQLSYLKILIEKGSFNKAAQALHITQAGLSEAIKALETEVGIKLLERSYKGVTLTNDGKTFFHYAQSILKIHDQMLLHIYPPDNAFSGQIKLLSSNFFSDLIMSSFHSEFGKEFPEIEIDFINILHWEITKRIVNGQFDLGIVPVTLANQSSIHSLSLDYLANCHLSWLPLYQSPIGAVLSKNHLLSAHPTVNFSDIADYKTTSFSQDFCLYNNLNRYSLISNNIQMHYSYLLNHDAVCILPKFVYNRYFSVQNALTFRPLNDNYSIQYHLIWRENHYFTPVERIFFNRIETYFAQLNNAF